MSVIYDLNETSQSVTVFISDDDGQPITGLVAATFPPVEYNREGANDDVAIVLADLALITTAWSSGGVKERGVGYYRLDLPNAIFATQGRYTVRGEDTGKHLLPIYLNVSPQLTGTTVGALSSTERDAIATALLDLANGIETGVTLREAQRAVAAIVAGLVTGAGTGTEVFKGIGQSSAGTTRATVTVDANGNRSAVSLP